MKNKNIVAIVGRPNVGKSTFFNKVIGERKSVVKDIPGVTRDRVYGTSDWAGRHLTFIDTGGLVLESTEEINKSINNQAQIALEIADVVVFMVDGKAGVNDSDFQLVKFLRKSKKPILLVANKVDNPQNTTYFNFYQLGLGHPLAISAEHSLGTGDLLDEIVALLDKPDGEENTDDGKLKIAVVGKPNVGKSSLINKILGEERLIVSDVAGTTVDSIDSPVTIRGKNYVLIDTAGIRRKRSIELESVEQYAVVRSFDNIRRADIVLLVIDSFEEISEQDIRLAGYIHSQNKPSIIVINKWDKTKQDAFTINKYQKELAHHLDFMSYFRPVYVSALTGKRVEKIFDEIEIAMANNAKRIQTSILNEIIQDATSAVQPQAVAGRRLKIKYATQVDVSPPTFTFFVNDAKLMKDNYAKYLENSIRKAVDFTGTPIRIKTQSEKEK